MRGAYLARYGGPSSLNFDIRGAHQAQVRIAV
jgi:hypothetical protein